MAMSLRYLLSVSFELAMVLSSSLSQHSTNSRLPENEGFSVDLIHRDSPQSPYFNSKETQSERAYNTLTRSIARVKYRASIGDNSSGEPTAVLLYQGGQYLVNFSLGTPPVQILGILDTGSDLIWTQCHPCFRCFKQAAPLFEPQRSSTYQDVSCFSKECRWLSDARCDPVQGRICQYYTKYADGSYSRGNFPRETMDLTSSLGARLSFNQILFGCAHDSRLLVVSGSGIVGLSRSPLSLVFQLGEVAAGKFSYCLPSHNARSSKKLTGKLNFGKRAHVSGLGTVCTPLVLKYIDYYLTLKSVTVASVSNNMTDFKGHFASAPPNIGNILIDSGSQISYLNKDLYFRLESTVAQLMKSSTRVPSPSKLLQLCYRTLKSIIDAPFLMIFHFENADVKLGPANTFYPFSKGVWCFAFSPVFGRAIQTYGAHQQTNFLVGHDIQQKTVCFKPMDCTNSDI